MSRAGSAGSALTRRAAIGGAVAVPVALAAGAGQGAPDYAERFETWLEAQPLQGQNSTLTLRKFDQTDAQMSAVVHLDWAPGQRQWRLTGQGRGPEAAFAALLAVCTAEAQALGVLGSIG